LTLPEFSFHHLGIAVRGLPEAIPFYEQTLGYRLVSGPFDDPIQRVRVCFMERDSPGEVIELIAPLAEDSPLRDILRRGGGAYHTCYAVADLEGAIAGLQQRECRLLSGPVPATAFEQRRIAWLFTPTWHLLELVEKPKA
jgi:methylmalonyl-CoA/ethylmalonyl-CoA epimerase